MLRSFANVKATDFLLLLAAPCWAQGAYLGVGVETDLKVGGETVKLELSRQDQPRMLEVQAEAVPTAARHRGEPALEAAGDFRMQWKDRPQLDNPERLRDQLRLDWQIKQWFKGPSVSFGENRHWAVVRYRLKAGRVVESEVLSSHPDVDPGTLLGLQERLKRIEIGYQGEVTVTELFGYPSGEGPEPEQTKLWRQDGIRRQFDFGD
ncbi:MAG: hypothetical protein HY319_22870 [Armatimonadetes bacterium]|nr:hypothetical protein [Armatimonadota bacterium]